MTRRPGDRAAPLLRSTPEGMAAVRGCSIQPAAAALLLLLSASVDTARVNNIIPRHVGFSGGEITILGSDFAEDQYSQFQPELGNIVNFVNDWDSIPCKVNVYKTSKTRVICTVGPLRVDRGLGNRYKLHLTVDGQPIHSGMTIQYYPGYTPRVDSVEPTAGPPGSLVTLRGHFLTDRYSIDTKTAGDLQHRDDIIAWLRVGSEDCDPVNQTSGELYGLTSSVITCRTSTASAGPLSVQLMVTNRGLSAVKDNQRQVSSQDYVYDFLAVPQVTEVRPASLAAGGGAVVTVDGVGFDPEPGATAVTIGGGTCRVLTTTSTRLTCAAPADDDTAAQTHGGSGVRYEVWLDAEVSDLGDLSALTSDSDGYHSEVLLGAAVTDNMFGQAAAAGDKFVGRLSGWLRSPRLGQFVLTLKSDGAAQLRLGSASDSLQVEPAVEASGDFSSLQKSAMINMTEGQMVYFEAAHKQGPVAGGYRLQVGLIDYNSPVTSDETRAATADNQVIYIKGDLRQEQQVLSFENVPAQTLSALQLEFNGVVSKTSVDASTATDDTWRSAVEDMFSAQCEYAAVDQAWMRTYEEVKPETGRETGVRKNEVMEPWCGSWIMNKPRSSLWATNDNNERIQLTRHRWLCLAHWGKIVGSVNVQVDYRDENNQWVKRWKQFDAELPSVQSWTYSCVDLVDKLGEISQSAKLLDVRIPFNWAEDVYFDDVSFSAQEKTLTYRRPAALLGAEPLFVREVQVTTSTDPLTVAVTLKVAACANQLPLIRIAGTNATAMADTSRLSRLTMAADSWGQGIVTNVRNASASPAPAGSWDIMFNGQTVQGVPTNLTAEGMGLLLSTRLSLPGLVVHRSGECDKYHWYVSFRHHGGRQPSFTVNGSNVQFDGDNLNVGAWKNPSTGHGRVTHDVLPADLTRLPRSVAGRQVKVMVAGVTSQCAADCDVTYDVGLNARVTAVSSGTDEVSGDTSVTIAGSNLGTAPEGARVTLNGAVTNRSCAVTTVTGTEVTCTVKNLQAGRYAVTVTTTDAGLASGSGEVSVAPRLVSVSPAEGSRRGGTIITLRGQRMPHNAVGWQDGTVTVGGTPCRVINSTSTTASCRVEGDVGEAGSAVDVTVTFGDRSATLEDAFTTLVTNAAITALNVTSSSAAGGDILGITGSGFGRLQVDQSVTVGGAWCDVTSWRDTEIACRLPPLGHGDHSVEVIRGQLGLADNSAVSAISTVFKVTDVSPRLASVMGGSVVRLRGEGLAADCDRLNITAGDLFTCEPVTCTDTEVTCRLQRRRRRHVVRNNVTHPRYGVGFLWEPQQLTVAPGDLVSWRWAPGQVSSGSVGFAVHQTASQDTDEYHQTGFNSGDKTKQGSFTTMLEDIGTVFYSGPPVGTTVPRMRGVINVEAPPVGDSVLSVRVGPVEAMHDPTTATVPAFEPSELCSADTAPASCPGTEDPLLLRAADCVTPRVTEVMVSSTGQGSMLITNSELLISGNGFSSTACHNRVMIGSGSCVIIAAAANQLTCRVTAAGVPHGAGQPLQLSIANRGEAVIDEAASLKYFRSAPTVSGVSPGSGSPTGGTLLKISGSSILSGSAESQPQVTVGTAPCAVQSVSLSELTCLTPPGTADDTAPVKLVWQDADGQTWTVGNTTFTYDATKTPTLSSVEVSGAQRTLTISGDKLGTDASKVFIRLIPRITTTNTRRRRQVDTPASDGTLPGADDVTALGFADVTALDSDDVISLDSDDAADAEPAVEAARREDAAFWRRFCHGDCDSFGAFVSSGQLRAAGSGPAVAVTASATPSTASGDEDQDFIELTPEYVSAFREAAVGRSRARRRVHLRRRRSISSSSPSQELTCDSVTLTDGGATCQLPGGVSGTFDVQVAVSDMGTAEDTVAVTVKPAVATSSLSAGSQHGGARIQLDGAGFGEEVSVTIGGAECRVTAATATTLECLTPPGDGSQPLVLMSGGLSVDGPVYTYSAASTPVITSVNSQDNSDVSVVSGDGTGLGTAAETYLTVGGRRCTVTSVLDTEFTCELESHLPGGQHAVTFHSPEGTGDSAPVDLSVPLEVTSVAPTTAGLAGTALSISGGKFDTVSPLTVTVCDTPCQVTAVTSTTVTCRAPAVTAAPAAACDVIVTMTGGASVASDAVFTYDASLTASVTLVTPSRGGTGGGTTVTVTGTGFAETGNIVTIGGVTCDVTSESVTQVMCVTNGHAGAGQFTVMVDAPAVGFAEAAEEAHFQYVDRWSSNFTWGGADPPSSGQSVSITAGQTILLDSSTPVLRLILIDGGELIFDPDAAFLELNAEYIVVVGGGKVQIGTEESPHQGQAAITLHGNVRATELPVYGAKVLAVRNGTLELHGRPVDITWTYLGSTAAAGADSITLDRTVSWAVGDEIVIASTGDKLSMGESEKRVISAVSADGLTLTLESPLAFEHISSEQTFAGQTVRMRAEVGLLTRNVKVRGSVNDEFTEQVEACAARFQPGQFDVQTCFHGRYGAETITDQFGATVMIHAKYQNQHLVTGRLEYVEVTEAGQAFRLGRYPIHYHLNGNVTGSYVRGCAIHRTYNRAVTIHAVDYLLVEHNVAYNNMGHAFFTEDGIEAYNVIQYNLAVFTRTSSSLLNVDVTPASFWVVNPTNIVRHNAAAGGTHFGFWYRPEKHPSGPSFTTSYCPNHAPMGEFYNNSAHSFGRYGLWVFSMDGYFPLSGGEDTCSGEPDVARFGQFLAWRCERGAEVVFGGALRFENFTVVDNEMSGLEMVKVKGPFGHDGPGVQNALVVGRSELAGDACTKSGIITPKQYIFNVDGATFVNFDGDCTALGACSQCKPQQGGFHHQFRRIVYVNSPNKMKWKWTHESVFHDTDGSLAGKEDGVVLPWMDILPPDHCTKGLAGFDINSQVVTAVCDSSVSIHRMAFNQPKPTSLLSKTVNFTTVHGTTATFWHKKRLTHPNGWMALLVGGENHQMEFADSNQLTNISYDAGFYFLKSQDRLAVSHAMLQKPDRFQAGGAPSNGSGPLLDFSAGKHGDIHWDNDTYTMSYLVAGQSRSRRAAGPFEDRDKGAMKEVKLVVERCFFEDCMPPPVPTVPTGRPDNVQLWSQATENEWTVPGEMEDVTIPADLWVLTDVALPPIRRLIIYGVLEIGDDMDNVLNCTHIVVYGKLVAGTAEQAFQHQLTVLLRGRHRVGSDSATADIPMPAGAPNVGWKTLATFGGLELYGTPRSVQWTSLSAAAATGADSLQLVSAVDWPVGVEVVITTGSFESRETEVRRVIAVSEDGTQLTINDTLQYDHLATEVALPGGKTKLMAAKVGLLTRNIRIEGDSYDGVIKESFGARVLASSYYETDTNIKKTASVRLSNVEFRLAGQDGWSDSYDPRYALALHSLGDSDATIVNCSFNHLFSPAIGIFYSNNVTVRGSVIMHTVGSGIIDEGSRNRLENNLVSWLVFPGTYNNRVEPENLSWDAAFRVNKATNLTLIGNVVAGSERLGFHIGGTDCSAQSSWADNEAHGALHGVHMFGKIKLEQCAKVSGFFVWRSWDFGIYFHVPSSSVVIDDNVLVENTMNILPMLYEPSPLAHLYENKRITVSNTVVVAVAAAGSCAADTAPAIASYRAQVRAPRTSTGGRTGIVWGQFLSRKVGAPKKTWHNPMSYPAVRGNTYLSGVHLINFNRLCSGQRDIAISTLVGGDDAQHPIITDTVSFTNVNSEDKLFLHKPKLGKVNPSDCVDMDCDGQKHALLIDTDGSIIGSAGTAVPQAEYEFDGDDRHGVGYCRVPESAVTELDGTRVPYADKMPNKGVWRGSGCTWQEPWRAYTCPGGQQRMLVIESMDADTEVRRVSPIALIANPGSSGFVDLLNGPQDMGWCFGYTCQERISTFYSLIAPGRVYEMHFTGTPPQHLRFHFLNAEPDMAIVLKIWYPKSQRYDVYYEEEFVYPTNVEPETFNIIQSENPEDFVPKVTSTKNGENYFSRTEGYLHVLIRGPGIVEIKQQPVIVLKMGFVSEDDFFETDVLNRLADLLGIGASQLRMVNIVREASVTPLRRRRRRETAETKIEFEIGSAPASNPSSNDTAGMTIEELEKTQAKVVDGFQTGEMDQALGVKVEGIAMVDPEPPATDPTNGVKATNETGGEDLSGVEGVKTYAEEQLEKEKEKAEAEAAGGVTYERPSELALDSAAVSGAVQELTRLSPLIKLYMKDAKGARMSAVGHTSNPWQVQAELISPPSGVSLLQTRVPFENGVATFSRLMVSGVGTGLRLRFRVVHPASTDAEFAVEMLGSFATLKKELEVRVAGDPGEVWHKPGEKISPGVRVEIRDPVTGGLASAAALRGHTWVFQAALYKHADGTPNAALQGTRRMELAPPSGESTYDPAVVFDNLKITPVGWSYLIKFTVTSPDDANVKLTTLAGPFQIQSVSPSSLPVIHTLGLTMKADFATVSNRKLSFSAELLGFLEGTYNSHFTAVNSIKKGSIRTGVTTRDSSEERHRETVGRLRRDLANGLVMTGADGASYPFDGSLLVDGVVRREKEWHMPPWTLALICIMATLLFVGILVLIWICCCNTVQRGKVQHVDHMAFKVPINSVPPPPFAPGKVNSFNIRMSIMDPNRKVAPSVIEVTSDDPLANMEKVQLDDFSAPASPLAARPPVSAPLSAPEPSPAPESAPDGEADESGAEAQESKEQRLQKEAKQAQEKAEKEAAETRQAEKAKAEAALQETDLEDDIFGDD